MPLKIPAIDDRNYQQILKEALARIPVHNPEWTNFNDSDPGITLIQLFAFMSESLLYRSNLIPERNRVKFLKLLGVPMRPAETARGIVTFSKSNGPLTTDTLAPGLELETGQVPFVTQDAIDILPIEAKVYYKKTIANDQISTESTNSYLQLYAGFHEENKNMEMKFYETRQLEAPVSGVDFPVIDLGNPADTVDGSLWIALLARKKDRVSQTREVIANKILTLGILPALTGDVNYVLPAGPISSKSQPELIFSIASGEKFSSQHVRHIPNYKLLPANVSGNLLSEPGLVHLTLPGKDDLKLWENLDPLEVGTGNFPPSLEDTGVQARVVTWIRIQVGGHSEFRKAPSSQLTGDNTSRQLQARMSWVGINAARVQQYTHVSAEIPGQGTGAPDQIVTLANTPVILDSIALTVNGEKWRRVDDLMTAGSEVPAHNPHQIPGASTLSKVSQDPRVFFADRESGEIRFGDGLRGTRPPVNSIIRVSYNYGGGAQGNVGPGAINKGPGLPNGVKVINEIPTWGGAEAESIAEAEKHIPAFLRHRDRLVTSDDFKIITQRTPGVALGRVEVLPLFHPDPNLQNVLSPGVVTIMVIPQNDALHPDTPEPDRLFLNIICDYLDPRRLVTTELHVVGPEYVPVWISIGIDVVPGMDFSAVRKEVKKTIRNFLSSLTGGFEEKGWPLAKIVESLEIWARATQINGISKVNGVLLARGDGPLMDRIEMKGLQLPRILGISVENGEPQSLNRLPGEAGASTPDQQEIFPVPVIVSKP